MINKIKPFVLIILTFGVSSHGLRSQEKLKVMTYNIWNGFDWGKDFDRKIKFIDWVNTQNPDVLALQELCGYDEEKLKSDARREEAKIIMDKLSKLSTGQNKYLVLGDFNALSPFDAHLYKDNPRLLENKRASEIEHDHVRNLLEDQLEYSVLGSLLGYPLIDVVQRFTSSWDNRVSCPTQVFESEKGEGRPINSTRIDYILSSPFLATKCVNAGVLNKKDTYYLSDHYPVMAEFDYPFLE